MTGKPDMRTDALREYFLPLEKWLKKENKRNGVRVGWDHDDSKVMCSDQTYTTSQTTDQPSTTSQTGQNTLIHAKFFTYILTIDNDIYS